MNPKDFQKWDGVTNHRNCIYAYVNKQNGKIYVGQTEQFKIRHGKHCQRGQNKAPIDRALNKYGVGGFEIFILEENLQDHDVMNEREIFYIAEFDSFKNGYNQTMGGGGMLGHRGYWKGKKIPAHVAAHLNRTGKSAWNKGMKMDEAWCEKDRLGHLGKPAWNKGLKGVTVAWNKGKKCPQLSESQKGKIITEEQRRKISQTLKGNIPWNKGVPMTEEHRLKDRLTHLGKISAKRIAVLKVDFEGNILCVFPAVTYANRADHVHVKLGKYNRKKKCFYIKATEYETFTCQFA